MKAVHQDSVNLTANSETDGACFTISHFHQNGELIGESEILCAEGLNTDDTELVESETSDKGCSSTNQGPITWLGLLGLIGLSRQNRRDS